MSESQVTCPGVVLLMQECRQNLAECGPQLLMILFSLVQDEWQEVSQPCVAYLRPSNQPSSSSPHTASFPRQPGKHASQEQTSSPKSGATNKATNPTDTPVPRDPKRAELFPDQGIAAATEQTGPATSGALPVEVVSEMCMALVKDLPGSLELGEEQGTLQARRLATALQVSPSHSRHTSASSIYHLRSLGISTDTSASSIYHSRSLGIRTDPG